MEKTSANFWAAVVGYATSIVNYAAPGEEVKVTSRMIDVFKELASIDFHEASVISGALKLYHIGEEARI